MHGFVGDSEARVEGRLARPPRQPRLIPRPFPFKSGLDQSRSDRVGAYGRGAGHGRLQPPEAVRVVAPQIPIAHPYYPQCG